MARDQTWLSKLKTQISQKLINPATTKLHRSKSSSSSKKSTHVGVLAFEIAGLLSKLLALHHSLSDASIVRLKNDLLSAAGVHKLVSSDDSFLLSLAVAEIIDTLRLISSAVTRLSNRCSDDSLRHFSVSLQHFADTGLDFHGWSSAAGKDLDAVLRRADRLIAATSALSREMEELALLENSLIKKKNNSTPGRDDHNLLEIQQKIVWQKQEVKHVREKSLWNRTFDSVVFLSARLIFTIVSRIKLVFAIGNTYTHYHPLSPAVPLPRSLSASAGSATVFPSSDLGNPNNNINSQSVSRSRAMWGDLRNPNQTPNYINSTLFVSGPLTRPDNPTNKAAPNGKGFFETHTKALKPAANTLGAAALALHYANLIIIIEKMIKAPHLVGLDAREDVYSMLPSSIRSALRTRLKGVGFSATDPVLAGEWRDALGRILFWLAPMGHNMIKWQSERSFEHHNMMPNKSNNVFLLQTLFFADREKTEAAITELLVGLNYIWRFEREMNAMALFQCSNFFSNNNKNLLP